MNVEWGVRFYTGNIERVADERRRREGYEAVSAELTRAATLWREGALH